VPGTAHRGAPAICRLADLSCAVCTPVWREAADNSSVESKIHSNRALRMMHCSTPKRRHAGFTLIELMIAAVVVGILAAVAIPAYQSQVRKGRRSDAVDIAARVMQAQERWRSENSSYATLAQLNISSPSAGGYYSFALSGIGATGYTLTFTGLGSQASDSGCTTLVLTIAAGNATYAQPACWSR